MSGRADLGTNEFLITCKRLEFGGGLNPVAMYEKRWAANQKKHRCRAKMHLVSSDWPPIFLAYMSVRINFEGKNHFAF